MSNEGQIGTTPVGAAVQELHAVLEATSSRLDRITGRVHEATIENKKPVRPSMCLLDTLSYRLRVLMDLATHVNKMSAEVEARLEGLE